MKQPRFGPRAGSLLVEALIALVVLVTAVLAFSRTATAGMQQQRGVLQRATAVAAAEELLEALRDVPVGEVFARYNATEVDDPALGTSPGPAFDVPGLRAPEDAEDGLPGRVLFPVQPAAGGELELREDLEAVRFGLPYDLDGDGAVESADVASTYRLLPVAVRVRWRAQRGVQEIELRTWLGGPLAPDPTGSEAEPVTAPSDPEVPSSDQEAP